MSVQMKGMDVANAMKESLIERARSRAMSCHGSGWKSSG